MIEVVAGPLISQPEVWTLVFAREAKTWWVNLLAMGRHKHVRAFAYVPYLHVWIFYDVHLTGTDIIIAADGEPAGRLIDLWAMNADVVTMKRAANGRRSIPMLGLCVPAMRRLLGVPGSALRPTAFLAECLKNGGVPTEASNGRSSTISTAGDGPAVRTTDGAERQG